MVHRKVPHRDPAALPHDVETAFQFLHKLRSALVAPDPEPLRGGT